MFIEVWRTVSRFLMCIPGSQAFGFESLEASSAVSFIFLADDFHWHGMGEREGGGGEGDGVNSAGSQARGGGEWGRWGGVER